MELEYVTHFPQKHSQHLCYINYGSPQFELLLTLVSCVLNGALFRSRLRQKAALTVEQRMKAVATVTR